MILGYGYTKVGKLVVLTGHTTSELEAMAGRERCVTYSYPVEGDIEHVRLIAGEWVRL